MWIDVNKCVPQSGDVVLVYNDECKYMVCIYENEKFWWDIPDDTADWYTIITHWMPLPAPPNSDNAESETQPPTRKVCYAVKSPVLEHIIRREHAQALRGG